MRGHYRHYKQNYSHDNVYQYGQETLGLIDGKLESQYNTQDYYAAMTNVIQEVFSKEGVDMKSQLDLTAKSVQENDYNSIKPHNRVANRVVRLQMLHLRGQPFSMAGAL